MALIGNSVRLATSNPMRVMAAPQHGVVERAQWSMGGAIRNHGAGWASVEDVTSTYGIPSGHSHPGAWSMPQKAGGMASRNLVLGDGDLTISALAGGLNGDCDIVGSGVVSNADLRLLIIATANVVGAGSVTASIQGAVQMLAAINGSGVVSGTLNSVVAILATIAGGGTVTGSMAGVLNAAASLVGSGTVSDANLGGVLLASCAIDGTGALTADVIGAMILSSSISGSGSVAAGITALAHAVASIIGTGPVAVSATAHASMSCDITSVSELSPQSLAAAVWNSLVASFQSPGSMGEALATAGSGGLSPTQVTMLTELYRLAGLDATRPLVVTSTTRDAGVEIEQTIVEAPAGTVTVTRT